MNECSRIYPKFNIRKQICAGSMNSTDYSCQGDDGGGLFTEQNFGQKRWITAGIISHGIGCAINKHPHIYTRVSAYYDWIQSALVNMHEK
jgi:secreted trypsin-like serine protease